MVYPGTCRHRPMSDATAGDAIRLNLNLAVHHLPESLTFEETGVDAGIISFITAALQTDLGDPVLRRKETGDPAYHLACVHDDARQNVSHVVRGTDLQALTPLHVALQHLLALPTPVYHHHCLVRDGAGKRLAKIDRSKALAKYRAEGVSVADIKRMIGFVD